MRVKDGMLTDMEEAYVKNILEGMTDDEAARQAGFSDWRGEGDRIRKRPRVQAELLKGLRKSLISNELLRQKALRVLEKNMRESCDDDCMMFVEPDPSKKWCSCGFQKIKASDANVAALGWLRLLKDVDPDTLRDKAKSADEKENAEELVEQILGPTSVPDEPPKLPN